MVELDNLRIYLPKYLSPDTENKLVADLSDFPDNIDKRMYGFIGKEQDIVYQGDTLKKLPCVYLPSTTVKKLDSIVLSNTCDVDVKNIRKFPSNLLYSPIFSLKKYRDILLKKSEDSEESVNSHISDIKRQKISQILYLPVGAGFTEDKIVFFDQMCNCDNNYVERVELNKTRVNSLSQYGFYVLLYKVSIHFTRFQEKVDREY